MDDVASNTSGLGGEGGIRSMGRSENGASGDANGGE